MKQENIILIGMPGSGKTTIARFLSMVLGLPIIDIDTYIEDISGKHVGDILSEVGDDNFLEFEKNITLTIDVENTIISCSGSSPLKQDAMNYLRKTGKVIFVDTPTDIITKRLGSMKVDRIVGMKEGTTLEDILKYRKTFYDKSYDYLFLNEGIKCKKQTFKDFLEFFTKLEEFKDININKKMLSNIYTDYNNYKS